MLISSCFIRPYLVFVLYERVDVFNWGDIRRGRREGNWFHHFILDISASILVYIERESQMRVIKMVLSLLASNAPINVELRFYC